MNTIIVIVRGNVDVSPTIRNYLNAFNDLNYEVYCICSSKKSSYDQEKVKFYEIGSDNRKNPVFKLLNYYRFGRKALTIVKNIYIHNNTIIWVARIDTAFCLGMGLKKFKAILALHELHDRSPVWLYLTRRLCKYYNNIVYNEINRANIARVWHRLPFTPSVIPNKPHNHPRARNVKLKDPVLNRLINNIKKNKKILLYQGSLLKDRNIEPLVKASLQFGEKYVLVLMGRDCDNRIESLQKINPELVHIDWITPPDHLFITSHAHICTAFYDFDCLNSIYCAPNKIWEYSGFGIPVLGQAIPGLLNTIGASDAGLCVNIDDTDKITEAIHSIDNDYDVFSKNATRFYDSTNFLFLVQQALDKVR